VSGACKTLQPRSGAPLRRLSPEQPGDWPAAQDGRRAGRSGPTIAAETAAG
jgi:hypothetical protein